MGLEEFKVVADNGYRRRTPPVDWEPVIVSGGLLGVPRKPIDFTNPYHPQNSAFYDPVIFDIPERALVFIEQTQDGQNFSSLNETKAFHKLSLALKSVETANERVNAFITQARALLQPSSYSINMQIK